MPRTVLLFLILFFGHRLFAQHVKKTSTYVDCNLIKQEKPYKFHFGRFFGSTTSYAILLDTLNDNKQDIVYCDVKFFEKVDKRWQKKNEYDSLQLSRVIQTRFSNYNNDTIKDYLLSAGIVGTGGNETEYLFIFDIKTKTLKLINGFENLPTTSYNPKSGIITSIGLAAGIPNFQYYKISNFHLTKTGGKKMWSDNGYGYLEKYKMVDGKMIVYYKDKKKLPIDFYEW